MPEVSLARWNEYLQDHPQSHFLQSGEWGELKAQYGWDARRVLAGRSGAQILFRRLPLGVQLAYIPKLAAQQIGPEDAGQFWQEVDALCRGRGAIACKLEMDQWAHPDASQLFEGFTPSPHSIQPRRTLVIDLRPDEDTMLGGMKQKCRYNVRLAQKKGVSVRSWSDTTTFHGMLRATGQRDGFAVHAPAYYAQAYTLFHAAGMCELLMAESEGQPLAALMVFARGSRAWYVYGGSTDQQREKMPNYLLQWEAMRWARERGCSEYDLWGVPDEDEATLENGFSERSDGLWGVYRFKRGFGGELRRAATPMDRIFNPFLYRLYVLGTKSRGVAT
jgi:lipid II:glycine glycyltransferase (peptidoglycan interpeptide bridge formation enzyme)